MSKPVRIDKDTHKELKEYANLHGMLIGKIASKAVREFLARNKGPQ